MSKDISKKLIIAVVFLCIIFSKINIFADTSNKVSAEALAVILVIDTSGSMATTDPQRLRETAANIFMDLLSPDDYLGIITFNSKEEVIVPMQQIQSNDNKANFKKILSQKLQASGDTDYLLALNEANKQLSSVDKGNLRKVIVFLTDGEPDPSSTKNNDTEFMNSYMNSLWKTVSDLSLKNYAVYSVGFSKGVDPAILERISSSTKGVLKISDDSSELASSFFDILGILKNRNGFLNKTFELNGSNSLEFNLDEYTSQVTMVFTNNNGKPLDVTLSPPDSNSEKSIINVSRSDKYNIVTINQKKGKLTGSWKVNLIGNGTIRAFGNLDKNGYDTAVKVDAKDTQTKADSEGIETKVPVASKAGYLNDNITLSTILVVILAALPVVTFLIGLLLYKLRVYKSTTIQGKLLYWKESDHEPENKKEFDFNKLRKEKIVITFNEENKNAQYHIFHDKYNYDIELNAIVQKSRWKFIDGFKALFNRMDSSELLLKTTEPGIFIYGGKVFSSNKIYKDDKFTTGGYVFQYLVDDKDNFQNKGKDVLEKEDNNK